MLSKYVGFGNLGIIFSDENNLLDFSSGKLVFTEDKVENRKNIFYNSLIGPTEYPEFAEEIC